MYVLVMMRDSMQLSDVADLRFMKVDSYLSFTTSSLRKEFTELNRETIDRIISLPCLFMYNFSHSTRLGITASRNTARVCKILQISSFQNNGASAGLRLTLQVNKYFDPIDSLKLSEQWQALSVDVLNDEHVRSHWAIKDVDLARTLANFGLGKFRRSGNVPHATKSSDTGQEMPEMTQNGPQPFGTRPRIFVVHGRGDGVKNEVARWLSKIGMAEIILHEQPNRGRSILTKFREIAANVSFAVVIATPDDVGSLIGERQSTRARQNVIFEMGFFIGALGPERVALLRCDHQMELPSDYSGIVLIDYDTRGAWKADLAKELKALDIPFNTNAFF